MRGDLVQGDHHFHIRLDLRLLEIHLLHRQILDSEKLSVLSIGELYLFDGGVAWFMGGQFVAA